MSKPITLQLSEYDAALLLGHLMGLAIHDEAVWRSYWERLARDIQSDVEKHYRQQRQEQIDAG